ncbi:MAG: hypothetical protein Q8922_15940 [Bacteroidota bacterium]|nr:hypothetical protein [Bacteroidota bacterium]MDP4233180.1 hypothetical protein [Bacteroidota bacterium]MDP4242201.1 hypothetical protein [Bacteroidota bacterium]MDP4289405.1 hypothetical protein [Bacteroidota bacterium]
MKILAVSCILFCASIASLAAPAKRPSYERTVHLKSFKGRVALTELGDGRIEVRIKTWRTSRDTVRGETIFPVLANGTKESFYCGHFGASRLPMLIFTVRDPDRIDEARCLTYQIAPNGALIGQQVILDEATKHSHTDEVASGRYQLAAINPEIGAIYSIAYQDAHFEGYFVSYEKLRVRQWDPAINAFIEADQGFLRDTKGRLVQATRYGEWSDRYRAEVFTTNVQSLPHYVQHTTSATKIVPVSAMQQK